MKRAPFGWYSPALGRHMGGIRYGDRGKAVVLFATAAGDEGECERFGLIGAIAPLIEAGRLQVYAVASIAGDAWLNEAATPQHKAWLQGRFDAWLSEELVPMIRHESGDPQARFIAAGASLGAYNAVNALAKHPEAFWLAIAMSGTYDFDRFMRGERPADYYFNQPLLFVPNLPDGPQLEALRRSFFLIATGQGRWEAPAESQRFGEVLGEKGIPNHIEMWGYDVDHDWPTWRSMLPMFLDRFV